MAGKSELGSLFDLATTQGIPHSQLVTEIYEAVLGAYRLKYPKSLADATVLFDETSGKVRIFSGDNDVTPADWGVEAAQIARQTVIDRLAQGKPAASDREMGKVTKSQGSGGLVAGIVNLLFWGYNLYFTLVIWLWMLGAAGGIKSIGVFRGLLMLVLAITPVVAMGAAIKNKLSKSAGGLMKLFFLIELPIVLAAVLPLSITTQLTPFMAWMAVSALGVPVVLYFYASETKLPEKWLRVILGGQQMVLMMAGYLGLLLVYWVPVVLGGLARSLLGDLFYGLTVYPGGYGPAAEPVLGGLFQGAVGVLILVLVSGILLVPYLLILVVGRAWDKTRRQLGQVLPEEQVTATVAVWAAVILTVGAAAAYQPSNARLVDVLRKITTLTTFEEQEKAAAEIRPQETKLKRIVGDMVNARVRYWFTKDDTSLQTSYEEVFNLGPEAAARVQKAFLTVAYPLVYQGERSDYSRLANNFQYVFGRGVNEGPTTPQAEAKNVLMTYRKVTVKPELGGAAATVAIEEEYDNQTYQQQEVVYEFSLPTEAAVTGLRLGANLEFPGVIAPKGAAQRTYEQQLQVRRDPALLEEIGPGRYRLRVFPVPAKNDFNTLKGKRQKVEYTYAVTAMPDGYPLPLIDKKTNVFSNTSSRWLLSTGERLKEDDRWIAFSPGATFDPCSRVFEQTVGEEGLSASIKSAAGSVELKKLACGEVKEAMQNISGARVGIFYDVAATNEDDRTWEELVKMFNEDKGFVSRNTVELYRYNERLGQPIRLTEPGMNGLKMNYFGRSNVWKALSGLKDKYDMVIVVTSAEETWVDGPWAFSPDTQVNILHTATPPAYSMPMVSKLTQSRGSLISKVQEAIREYALKQAVAAQGGAAGVVNGYFEVTFSGREMTDSIPAPIKTSSPGLTGVVNKALVNTAAAANPRDISGDITLLDRFNEFAKAAGTVTPYSSLIALVNELQAQQLEQWQEAYNRYQDQAATENVATRPVVPIEQPIFDNFGAPGLGMMKAPGISGGGIGIAGPTMMAMDGGGGGGSLGSSFGVVFVLVNGVLLAGGMGWYLIKILRKKS